MIAELNESNRPQFLAAVRGRPYFGDILPVHLAVFGRSGALMRFYVADGSAAVQLKGRSAVLCGTYDAEETGAFLRMQGVRYVNAGGAAPAGYSPLYALHNLVLAKAAAPPCPDAVRLTLDRAPAPAEVTACSGSGSPGAACGTLLQKRTAEFLPPSWLCGGGYRAALCAGRAAGGKIKGLRSREEKQGGVPPTLR